EHAGPIAVSFLAGAAPACDDLRRSRPDDPARRGSDERLDDRVATHPRARGNDRLSPRVDPTASVAGGAHLVVPVAAESPGDGAASVDPRNDVERRSAALRTA